MTIFSAIKAGIGAMDDDSPNLDSMIARYGGTSYLDEVANNNLTPSGGVDVNVINGNARWFEFDGVDSAAVGVPVDTGERTWKFSFVPNDIGNQGIFIGSSLNNIEYIATGTNDTTLRFRTSNGVNRNMTFPKMFNGVVYEVVLVRDDDDKYRMFVDGMEASEGEVDDDGLLRVDTLGARSGLSSTFDGFIGKIEIHNEVVLP